ncbi:MAG: glycosyltransferase [Bifidobacterium tibiigranuli]|jgi:glycosyltransferase involved in cell wall biosynthesis|uniref:glycosyltransferase n=1 Tax=Bifidobacterium tibiigranuli TaxID=2172043 RepID=UPI002356BB17|nr:glycosyltransferase [Bifidobacterium tibiigranuli]MCH3975189.1 glycosyltransferase [Bifidobacterium tibiigranuli]MCH4203387.1 glycosyltransferase [Bifidobacterium tibiigranuli]MCH4274001.1 glycosyltransferase [Bifidobacterium tibiigranuli]
MRRILHIIPEFNPGGGIENVVMNYYRNIDRSHFQFDVVTHSIADSSLALEFESLGGRITKMPVFGLSALSDIRKKYAKLIYDNAYDCVHCHMPNAAFLYLKIAKSMGVPQRILHSHQNRYADTASHVIRNIPLVALGKPYANVRLACSQDAGDFLFGHREYTILPNAIELDAFRFNKTLRAAKRDELGLATNDFVLGNVGRLTPQKNQTFLLSFLPALLKKRPDIVVLLVGEGPCRNELVSEARDLKVSEHVRFLGMRTDMAGLYSAMDAFVFPSLYEGLGEALIEAQVSGLPAIASTDVPKIAKINDSCAFIDRMDENAWINGVSRLSRSSNRENGYLKALGSQYDIESTKDMLEMIYRQ